MTAFRVLAALGAVLLAALPSGPTPASTATTSASVSINVTSKCSFGTSTLAFGTYDPIVTNKTTALLATGTISVTCNSGVAATISLDNGQNSTHAVGTTRAMAGGGGYLSYEVYTSSARSTVWNTTNTVPYTGTGSASTVSVYGTIPAGEAGATASYSDTVGITVSY